MLCTKPQEGPQKLILRSDQDGIDVKFDVNGRGELFQLGIWGKKSMEYFCVKGISGVGLRWTT